MRSVHIQYKNTSICVFDKCNSHNIHILEIFLNDCEATETIAVITVEIVFSQMRSWERIISCFIRVL